MTTDRNSVDIAVVGGGPAGAAAATLLAQRGHHVALFEKDYFPRFHVGESLIPAVNLTLAKIGLLDRLDGLRSPRKHGVQFYSPKGGGRPFYFSESSNPKLRQTWQVLRSDFDALLLDNARAKGVDVRTGMQVRDVEQTGERVHGIRVRAADGVEHRIAARVVLDASGQQSLLARRFGDRNNIPGLENLSVYAHYENVALDDGIDAGNTLIFRIDHGAWLWFIPLPDAVSIGLVTHSTRIGTFGGSSEEKLDQAIAACPPLAERLTAARRTTEVRAARDFTYRAQRDGGPGWALIGDALGFIDPMYSTGLFLAMFSAELAADAIDESLRDGAVPDLAGYSRDYQSAFDRFLALVRAYYTEDFHFGQFSRAGNRRQGLVDLLIGDVTTVAAIECADALRSYFAEQVQ